MSDTEYAPPPATDPVYSLSDALATISLDAHQVELLGAFNHVETAAGHSHDTLRAYRTRLATFAARPA